MNGAHALVATLETNDVDVCFANPGTSEMHFVAALDQARLRGVLCLFEGVATGAADGYARVTGRPAATLLHLGPGLANGWANLHNARRGHVPLVNVVGDHATYHERFDAPLQSNVAALADGLEGWYRRPTSNATLAEDTADAVAAAYGPPGRVATLVLPADVSWNELEAPPATWPTRERPVARAVEAAAISHVVAALRTRRCALVVGGGALDRTSSQRALDVAHTTGATLLMETFPSIMDHGAGVAAPSRVIYLSEFAIDQLKDVECVILVGAREPVGFFAYPNVPSRLVPESAEVFTLCGPGDDAGATLAALAEELRAPRVPVATPALAGFDPGPLTTRSFASVVAATLPEGVVVADESNTAGVGLLDATRGAPAHRWMTLTGGAIGYGLPVALGAAVGSGGRVLALEADGSMMYTLQALWTMAREGLDVTVVALANRSYAILTLELARVGAVSDGGASARMLELDDPTLDLAGVARALGVPAVTVRTGEELADALRRSYATPGPSFIEAVLPKGLS